VAALLNVEGVTLPTTLQADDSNGGLGNKIVFERVIVMRDGQRYIEGKTRKQLPPPASHTLPKFDEEFNEHSNISRLEH
jgi:hypothetical protein